MRHTKKWVLSVVMALVVVLAVGVIGGAVYAQSENGAQPDTEKSVDKPGDKLMSKVAAILEVDQTELENAFKQAQQELRQEALAERMAKLVEEGRITQEQANEYLKWWQSRPDVPAGLDLPAGPGGRPGICPQGPMVFKFGQAEFSVNPGNGKFRQFKGQNRPDTATESN